MSKVQELFDTNFSSDDLVKYKELIDKMVDLENTALENSATLKANIQDLEEKYNSSSDTIGKLQKNYREALSLIPVPGVSEATSEIEQPSPEQQIQNIVKGLLEEVV